MIDEVSLAKIICRVNLAKTFVGFKDDGKFAESAEPAVKLALKNELEKRWIKFLPEARAVLREIEGD